MDGQINLFEYMDTQKKNIADRLPIPRLSKDILSREGWIDDWHYCEIELPEETDVYFTISIPPDHDFYFYTYMVYHKGEWWFWDSWWRTLKRVKDVSHKEEPFAWVRVPSGYRKDPTYLAMCGMEGII